MKRTVVLVVLDGWGIGRRDFSNPVHTQNPQNLAYIKSHFPAGTLQASGVAVGLPWQEEGNSEVGHLTIGAGRVIYQHYPRISRDIKSGSFFKNETLVKAAQHAKRNGGQLNFVGLLTAGNVHAAFEHLQALVELGKQSDVDYRLHLFTDGKDGPLKAALGLLEKLPTEKIRTISGRYFGMDRDGHWDRTEKAYRLLTDNNEKTKTPQKAVQDSYDKDLNDIFVEPTIVGDGKGINSNDAVVFFNFREDSMRQIVSSFYEPAFDKFEVLPLQNLYLATFTPYGKQFPDIPVAFPPEPVVNCLGEVLSKSGKSQLRIAETEKYAHVTYFFNGLHEQPFKNEYRILLPSRDVPKHNEFPEMRAEEITTRLVASIDERAFDFILANYANADMVAHTGDYEAGLKAVQIVDESIGALMKAVLNQDALMIITADHGNVERMLDPTTGQPETKHDPNPVPVYLVGKEFMRNKDQFDVDRIEEENTGILSDVAPTVLELMGIPQPPEMTGSSLLRTLR